MSWPTTIANALAITIIAACMLLAPQIGEWLFPPGCATDAECQALCEARGGMDCSDILKEAP